MTRWSRATATLCSLTAMAGLILFAQCTFATAQTGKTLSTNPPQSQPDDFDFDCDLSEQGSPYIPVDSWIYPAAARLYALGYTAFLHQSERYLLGSN